MPDTSEEKPSYAPVTGARWVIGYLLPGIGLLALGFVVAARAPADAIGLGGFLCFFTLGVTLIVEGTKRFLKARRSARPEKE